jgi:hypothetical protein
MAETLINDTVQNNLEEMYHKVVSEPNDNYLKRGYIKCSQCGDLILMIPTLKAMNTAIENHVKVHKELLKSQPFQMQKTAIQVRLNLAQQVLRNASKPDIY